MIPASSCFSFFRYLSRVTGILLLTLVTALAAQTKISPPGPVAIYRPPTCFFTVELDSHYQFIGTGALTEEDAKRANCYRFIYKSNGKLQSLEYRRAGLLMPDPLLGVARIDFEYQPGLERRWFKDAHSQPMRDVDGIEGEELTLNAAGYPTDVINLGVKGGHTSDSNGVIHYVRTLDEFNRLIKGRRLGLFGTAITDKNGFFEVRTAYDLQGLPLERGNYDDEGNLLNNNDGVAVVRYVRTINPDSTQVTEIYYDASGEAVEEKSSGVHQCQRLFDQRGLLIEESYFDAMGSPTDANDDRVHERRFTFDDRANQVVEEFLDNEGKPVNRRSAGRKALEYAKAVYKYDDKNRVIELAYFGDDGAPQIMRNLGAAFVRQEYDDQGNIVRQEFFDGLGHPSPHVLYGAPAIRVQVQGDTTQVSLENDNDKPVKNPINGYYAFSYKTATDHPLSLTNLYFDRHGRQMSQLRVRVINPHLHALKTNPVMQWSARLGVGLAGLGALLGGFLNLRKSSHTRRRKVYIPSPLERFLGWLATFGIFEGSLRFFMTIYWAWVNYENGRMGSAVYVLESIFIMFFLYRLYRLHLTLRVLNIDKDDIHRLVRDFFAKANLKPQWIESESRYISGPIDITVNYYRQKYHAYLAFRCRGRKGQDLPRGAAQFLRAQVKSIQAPARTQAIALYYPTISLCYFLLAGIALYTLWQLLKGF